MQSSFMKHWSIHPGSFSKKLNTNTIFSCTITFDDLKITRRVCGPIIGTIKGKTTQSVPEHVKINIIKLYPKVLTNMYHLFKDGS